MVSGLNPTQLAIKNDLEQEANQRRQSWSCRDHIQNGDETGIDCGGTYCAPCSAVGVSDDQNGLERIKIFPNPTNEVLKIQCPLSAFQVEISTVSGKRVLKQAEEGNTTILDVSSLSDGLYIVQILNAKNEVVYRDKLVKH